MRRTPVESSAISSIGYEARSKTLEVEFQSGSVYDYREVPRDVYESFLASSSKGRFFARRIRNLYESRPAKPREDSDA